MDYRRYAYPLLVLSLVALAAGPVLADDAPAAVAATPAAADPQALATAEAAFAAYDHSKADFFTRAAAPIPEAARPRIVQDGLSRWLPLLDTLTEADGTALVHSYGPYVVDAGPQAALGAAYARALARWRGWQEPLAVDQVWALAAAFAEAGIRPGYLPARRAVVILTGAHPAALPADWDIDPQPLGVRYVLSSAEDVEKTIATLDAAGFHDLLLLDIGRTAAINTLQGAQTVTGTRLLPAAAPTATGTPVASAVVAGTPAAAAASASTLAAAAVADPVAQAVSAANGLLPAAPAPAAPPPTVTYKYRSATVARSSYAELGIYYVDTANKLVFRSRLEQKNADESPVYAGVDDSDPNKPALDRQSAEALAKFAQPLPLGGEPAAAQLGQLLSQPLSGSKWAEADLAKIIGDDEALFAHEKEERQRQAQTASDDLAETLKLDLGSTDDDAGVEAELVNLPDDASCAELLPLKDGSSLLSPWQAELPHLVQLDGSGARSSYVFLEAESAIDNLREDVARNRAAPDSAQAYGTALQALTATAASLQGILGQPDKTLDSDVVLTLDSFVQQRVQLAADNAVARRARSALPEVSAGLYRLYQYTYNLRYDPALPAREAAFATIDDQLQQLDASLAAADTHLVGVLNTSTDSDIARAFGAAIDAKCPQVAAVTPAAGAAGADKDADDDAGDNSGDDSASHAAGSPLAASAGKAGDSSAAGK